MGVSGLLKPTELGADMKRYQFRTNWRGKLILQRLYTWRGPYGDPEGEWRDAQTSDLKDYYQQLCHLQTQANPVREQFESECV